MASRKYKPVRLPVAVVGSLDEIPSKLKESDAVILATHNCRFHCDDALAIGMLTALHAPRECVVIRTRNPELLKQADCVVDVGGVCEPEHFRFDHHQNTFKETFSPDHSILLSSAGLVYKYNGKKLLADYFEVPADLIDPLHRKLYDAFVLPVDAIDNGVEISDSKPRYIISTDVSSRVARLNQNWIEWDGDEVTGSDFTEAVRVAMQEMTEFVTLELASYIPARNIVKRAYTTRREIHPSGAILRLEAGCPVEDALEDLEAASDEERSAAFVVYPNGVPPEDTTWRIKALRKEKGSFANRCPIILAGATREMLDARGFTAITFIHRAAFVAGSTSYEQAIKLAVESYMEGVNKVGANEKGRD